MTSFSSEQLNFFKFSTVVLDEFPVALRKVFVHMWDTLVVPKHGCKKWDDSVAVLNWFLSKEGGATKVPILNKPLKDWDCTALFKATLFSQSFAMPDGSGSLRTLDKLYVKPRGLISGAFHHCVLSPSGDQAETFALALDQLRLMRNTLCHQSSTRKLDKTTIDQYLLLAKNAFDALGQVTTKIDYIGNLGEDDFPTAKCQRLKDELKREKDAAIKLKQIEDHLSQVESGVKDVASDVKDVKTGLTDVASDVKEISRNVEQVMQTERCPKVLLHMWLDCDIVPEPGPQGGATNAKEAASQAPQLSPQYPSNTVTAAAHPQDVVTTQQVLNRIAAWYLDIAPRTPEGLSDFLSYMEKVRKVLVVEKVSGSLIITLECSSLEILDGLWQDYLTGHLNEMAQQLLVTEDILREFGLLEVKLKITILKAEYLACRKCFLHFQGIESHPEETESKGTTIKASDRQETKSKEANLEKQVEAVSELMEETVSQAGISKELKSEGGDGGSNTGRLGRREADLPKFKFIMDDAQFEFRSFLLQISKELTKKEFERLKFVLEGYVTPAKCEKMTEAFHYFEELQKMLLLTPTRFEVLKEALNLVGRSDLVEKLQEKEEFFSPRVTDGDNLEQTESSVSAMGQKTTKVDSQERDHGNNEWTLLHAAAQSGNVDTLLEILSLGFVIDSKNSDGRTPLMIAASNGRLNAFNLLLERGADPTLKDNRGWTVLHWAAYSNNDKVIEELLSGRLDIDSRSSSGLTPLMIAAGNGRLNAFNLLLAKGADPNLKTVNDGCTVLHSAANGNDDKIIDELLSRGLDIDSRSSSGSTPLMSAAFNGRLNAFNLLLERGADPTLEDNDGRTVLHYAAYGNNCKIIEKLLSLELNINSRNNNGETALMVATSNGKAEAVKYLSSKGARQ